MTETFRRPDPEAAVSLGEVAVRFRNVLGVPKGAAAGRHELLNCLQQGKLRAFVFAPDDQGSEIPVPPIFWKGVTTKRFAVIGYRKSNRAKRGLFELRLTEIPDAVAAAVLPAGGGRGATDAAMGLLSNMIGKSHQLREVYVRQKVLDAWVSEAGHSVDDQYTATSQSRGRGAPRRDWEAVWAAFAQVLVRLLGDDKLPKRAALAIDVYKQAKLNNPGLRIPEIKTIEGKIAELISGL